VATTKEIEIEIKPRKQFRPFFETDRRFSVILAHRRAGKTVACIQKCFIKCMTHKRPGPPVRVAFMSGTFGQVKDTAWAYAKDYARKVGDCRVNESELTIEFSNKAVLKLLSSENAERIRGQYFDLVVSDETADCPPNVFHSIIRPALADMKGDFCAIGTPKGRNHFWKMWNAALNDPDWFTLRVTADESGIIDPSELEGIRRQTPDAIFRQEFLCDFSVGRIGAIYARLLEDARNQRRISNDTLWHKECPVYTSWDVGMALNQRVWCWQIIGDRIVFLESLFGDHECGTPAEWAERLRSRGYSYGSHFIPHDAATTNGGLWEQSLRTAGLMNIVPVPRQNSVWDGVNSALEAMPRVSFNEEGCSLGLDSLDQYHARAETDGTTIRDVPVHDHASHAADAFSLAFQAIKAGLVVDRSALPRGIRKHGRPDVIMGFRG
jgi:phage terminase large subunit